MDEGQSIEEFLANIAAKAKEQDSFEEELLKVEIKATTPHQPGGTVPIAEDTSAPAPMDHEVKSKKFCTKCGAELKLGKAFCSNCGTQVKR